jgi:coronin-1B/1C/6
VRPRRPALIAPWCVAADSLIAKANPEYISVNWEASGGGAFAVIPLNEKGKLPDQIPLFRGHTSTVLDTDWCARDHDLYATVAI